MNTDIRLKVGFFHHTKIVRLERRLGAEGVLSLLRLFVYAAQNKADGCMSGMDAEEIEIASGWTGVIGDFVSVCCGLKLIDLKRRVYSIHDWHTHQPWAAGAEKRSEQAKRAVEKRWEKHQQKQPSNTDSIRPVILNDTDSNTPSPTPSPTLPNKPLKPSSSKNKFSDTDYELAVWIYQKIQDLDPGRKTPNLEKWSNHIRLMRERDNLTHREIAEVFAWANKDTFWQTNVLSVSKLREKFSILKLKMRKPSRDERTLSEKLDDATGGKQNGMDTVIDIGESQNAHAATVGFLPET